MTDSDDKLLRRYRALPREEPPRALDDAILAASRRAVAARPSASRRWAAPVSIAAVLVLAFGVTLEMQREEPGIESREAAPPAPPSAPAPTPVPAPSTEPMQAPAQAAGTRAMESDAAVAAKPPAAALRKAAPPEALKEMTQKADQPAPEKKEMKGSEPQAFPQSAAPAPAAAPPAVAPQTQAVPMSPPATLERLRDANVAPAMAAPRAKIEALDAAGAPARSLAAPAAPADPERELERIAKLREEGRDADADKALEEFKRKYPGLRIPDATWSRVKPR